MVEVEMKTEAVTGDRTVMGNLGTRPGHSRCIVLNLQLLVQNLQLVQMYASVLHVMHFDILTVSDNYTL